MLQLPKTNCARRDTKTVVHSQSQLIHRNHSNHGTWKYYMDKCQAMLLILTMIMDVIRTMVYSMVGHKEKLPANRREKLHVFLWRNGYFDLDGSVCKAN